MAAIHFTKENFGTEVMESKGIVLVDFWAPWCGPCKMLTPIIDQLADELTDVKIGKVNIDEEIDLAREYEVMTIPTLLVIKDGKVLETSVGLKPKAAIMKMLEV